jgi:nicotinamide riboside transporter PnuC
MKLKTERWIAAVFFMVSGVIQASAIINLQWFSWIITLIAIILTIRISLKDKDKARTTTQIFFLVLSTIAIYNWVQHK